MNILPTDIYRKIFKEYIYSQVIHELHQYHHSRRLKPVLAELIEECFNGYPGAFDEYLVNNDGAFIRPEPGWFSGGRLYFIRMDPEDSSRLQSSYRSFFFEIIPTQETQQLIDDFRIRRFNIKTGALSLNDPVYTSFFEAKKYYKVYILISQCGRSYDPVQILTFEKSDSEIVCNDFSHKDEYKYIRLPKGFNRF